MILGIIRLYSDSRGLQSTQENQLEKCFLDGMCRCSILALFHAVVKINLTCGLSASIRHAY